MLKNKKILYHLYNLFLIYILFFIIIFASRIEIISRNPVNGYVNVEKGDFWRIVFYLFLLLFNSYISLMYRKGLSVYYKIKEYSLDDILGIKYPSLSMFAINIYPYILVVFHIYTMYILFSKNILSFSIGTLLLLIIGIILVSIILYKLTKIIKLVLSYKKA